VIREAVQNGLDKRAKNIYIRIDCQRRIICIFDDGDGASYAEIAKKFENIGLSLKLADRDAIGSKGIGNLAGIAIALSWQLFTRDVAAHGDTYLKYSLDREELKKEKGIQVHCEPYPSKTITGAPFVARTMLRLQDVDEISLKQLGDQDTIRRTLTEAFSNKLKSRNVDLRVQYRDFKNKYHDFVVKPQQYRGAAMEPEKYDTEFGEVEFVFYHSPKPVEKPVLLVQHLGVFSMPLINFFKMRILKKEVEDLFSRGYFEGEIRLGFCQVNAARVAFVPGHELKVFVQAVDSFVTDILRPLVEQLDQDGRAEKHRQIAERLVEKVLGYFRKHPSFLPPTMKSFLPRTDGGEGGVVGPGGFKKTAPPTRKKPEPKPPLPPDAFKKQREQSKATGGTAKKKREPQIRDLGEGLSLTFASPDANEDGFLWHSRLSEEGLIQINNSNTEFLEAEKRGQTKLSEYLSVLLQKELTCASLNPLDARTFGNAFEKNFMVFWRVSLD
jgi:hypothetical protein